MKIHIIAPMLAAIGGGLLPVSAIADVGTNQLEVRVRDVDWHDKSTINPKLGVPNPKQVSYDQNVLGLAADYSSPYWGNVIGIDASVYGVMRLSDSGTPITQLVQVGNNGQVQDGFAAIGQALVKLRWDDFGQLRLGSQLQNSLLLKSWNNRVEPDSYAGISAQVTPLDGLRFYGSVYNRYRSRTDGKYEAFRNKATGGNNIDYLADVGVTYTQDAWTVTAEYLESKDYLTKFGLVGAYKLPVRGTQLKLSGGMLTSRDAGPLFVCGAVSVLDCTGSSRLSNHGRGTFVDAEWKVGDFTVGAAATKFADPWIKVNYSVDAVKDGAQIVDAGTNPFPTGSTIGADFANKDETDLSFRLTYDWKRWVPGLKTGFKFVRGTGAHSSNLSNDAVGKEFYREFNLHYQLPFAKHLSVKYVYLNYASHIDRSSYSETINGFPKEKWKQNRLYVDYTYKF